MCRFPLALVFKFTSIMVLVCTSNRGINIDSDENESLPNWLWFVYKKEPTRYYTTSDIALLNLIDVSGKYGVRDAMLTLILRKLLSEDEYSNTHI